MWDLSQFPRPLPKPEFEELNLYYAQPFEVTPQIVIHQPTVGEIIADERKYYSLVHTLTCTPTEMKVDLFDKGVNYMEYTDFDMFCSLVPSLTKDKTRLFFGDKIDFSQLQIGEYQGEAILYSEQQNLIIDKNIHNVMAWYIREINNITPKFEMASNRLALKMQINRDRQFAEEASKRPYRSQLKPLISALRRYSRFSLSKNDIEKMGIYEFMDCVTGAQIYVSSTALLQGSYSGMVDTSKINKNEFNWMRGVNDKEDISTDTGFTVQTK